MTVSQITPSQQALFYKLISNDMTSLSSSSSSNSSLLPGLGTSTDLNPLLSMALYNNCSSNIFGSLMNMFMNYFMQIIMMMFIQNLSTSQTTQATSEACDDGACSVSDTACTTPATIREQATDIIKLTNDNLDSDLRNQKGTSFVVVCGSQCGRCKKFDPVMESINKTLGTQATFYSLNGDSSAYRTLKKETGTPSGTYGYPIIIKCVDGVAKEFYSYSDINKIYTDETQMTEWFSGKI